MQRHLTYAIAVAATAFGAVGAADTARAQISKEIVGTWTLVSNMSVASDGKRTDTFGPNPKGTLMFDDKGHFAVVVMRSDLPKFASKSYRDGSPDDAKLSCRSGGSCAVARTRSQPKFAG